MRGYNTLPPAVSSLVTLTLYGDELEKVSGSIKPDVDPCLAIFIEKDDTVGLRTWSAKEAQRYQGSIISSALLSYAQQKNLKACAFLLKHTHPKLTPSIKEWSALAKQAPEELRWMGRYDQIARYFYFPMPCPNRDWCMAFDVDRSYPGPLFKTWWNTQDTVWQQAVEDHLRVEWRRRLIGQPKIYWLLNAPTFEQAVFAATRPEPVYDFETLEEHIPRFTLLLHQAQILSTTPKELSENLLFMLRENKNNSVDDVYTLDNVLFVQ